MPTVNREARHGLHQWTQGAVCNGHVRYEGCGTPLAVSDARCVSR